MNDISSTPIIAEQPAPEKRVWGGWATAGWGVVIIAVFIVVQAIVLGIALAVIAFPQITADAAQPDAMFDILMDALNANMGLLQSIATITGGIIGTGLIIIIIKARRHADTAEYLGIRKISIRMGLLSVGVVVAFIVLMAVIQTLLGVELGDQMMYDIYETSMWPALFWIAVVIFAPVFEEAFFRGFLFEGFLQSRAGALGAIAITSVTWALLHIQYNVAGITYILLLGIIMGILRWKTRSIWSPLIMHAVVNLISTVLIATELNG